MTDEAPPAWAMEKGRAIAVWPLDPLPDVPEAELRRIMYERATVVARALADVRRAAIEEALRWVDAIHEGKDNSRDPAVVDNTCLRIRHGIRALLYQPPAP